MNEWIKSLKAGDKIIVCSHWGSDMIRTIDKITPTGRINIDGMVFNQMGYERISGYNSHYLHEATTEAVKKIEEVSVINEAFKVMRSVTSFSYDQAVKILEILNPKEDK